MFRDDSRAVPPVQILQAVYCLSHSRRSFAVSFFFFNDTATTEIYTLSLHDALPIFHQRLEHPFSHLCCRRGQRRRLRRGRHSDRKSTRLNSSHPSISYAVFCLKKKKH